MSPEDKPYELFEAFVQRLDKGLADAGAAAETLVRITSFYPNLSAEVVESFKAYSAKRAEIAGQMDQSTLKPISTAKADVMADATEESVAYVAAKARIETVDRYIAALKFFVQGLSNEHRNA